MRNVLAGTEEDEELIEEGIQQKLFLKEIGRLRRLGQVYDRIVSELKKEAAFKKTKRTSGRKSFQEKG